MKTGKATIKGEEYLLCFSPRVLVNIEERNGRTLEEELTYITENQKVGEIMWLLHQLLLAGKKYADNNSIEAKEPPTLDYLLDCCSIDDFADLMGDISKAIENGATTDFDVKSKNQETTPLKATE